MRTTSGASRESRRAATDVDERVQLRPVDEQLLRVALLPTGEVPAAWTELRQQFAPEELDDGRVVQLTPLVVDALVRAGVDDPELGRMRGIRRHTFFAQQLLRADLVAALDVFEAAGVRSLALKGVPLVLEHYDDVSLRPMWDVDLLIDADRVLDALAALRAAGWRNAYPEREHVVRVYSEAQMRSPDGRTELDVHWRLVPWVDRHAGAADPELWAAAHSLDVDGRSTLAPAPEDLVLHVILHAFRTGWRVVPRWVADVAMVLRRLQEVFDWDRFVHRATQGRIVPPVLDALDFACELVPLPVPDDARRALRAAPVDRIEAYRYQVASRLRTGARLPVLGELGDLRVLWARHTLNVPFLARTTALPDFLVARTRAPGLWQVPSTVLTHRADRRRGVAPRRSPD
jgi:hypothetical protein